MGPRPTEITVDNFDHKFDFSDKVIDDGLKQTGVQLYAKSFTKRKMPLSNFAAFS